MAVEFISKDNIPYVWTALVPFVERFIAESQGESTLRSMLHGLVSGDYQCFAVVEHDEIMAICVTKIDQWETYSALHVLGVSGNNWPYWKDYHATLEDFARQVGCDRMSLWGRKGWKRMFDKHDFKGQHDEKYEEVYTVMHMKLKK